jgi:hypothetical protein
MYPLFGIEIAKQYQKELHRVANRHRLANTVAQSQSQTRFNDNMVVEGMDPAGGNRMDDTHRHRKTEGRERTADPSIGTASNASRPRPTSRRR